MAIIGPPAVSRFYRTTAFLVSLGAVAFLGGLSSVHGPTRAITPHPEARWGSGPSRPNEKDNGIVTWPPWGKYFWVDYSNIGTGFSVQIQRASSSCSSWTTVSTRNHAGTAETGQQSQGDYNFAHGYCWRVRVKANGQFASSAYVADAQPQWYP